MSNQCVARAAPACSGGGHHKKGKSFRPRPIDYFKKMPVIRLKEDLRADEEGLEEEMQREKRPIPQARRKLVIELPIPDAQDVPEFGRDRPFPYRQPSAYVKHRPRLAATLARARSVYEADDEDVAWLRESCRSLAVEVYERLVEVWEHAAALEGAELTLAQA